MTGTCVNFRAGIKYRADCNVVGTAMDGDLGIFNRSHRNADNESGWRQLPGGINSDIPLPEVNSICPAGDGYIKPVINDEQGPGLPRYTGDFSASFYQIPVPAYLVT